MAGITEILRQDHRAVEALFVDYETAAGDDRKQKIVEEIVRSLSTHAAIEELLVYPAVRQADDGSPKADHAIEEHQTIKRDLADLEKAGPATARAEEIMASLKADVTEHVAEEERDVLPALERTVDRQRLEQMGELAERMRGLLPTHPHPMVPGTATAQLLTGPLASVADHVRDLVRSATG